MIQIYSFSTDRKHCYYPYIGVAEKNLGNLDKILAIYAPASSKIPNIKTVSIEESLYPTGYRVVKKKDLTSLGLRRNPHILHYPINEWLYLPKKQIQEGPQDWGGISILLKPSQAKWMQNYMLDMHSMETRVFKAAFKDIIHLKERSVKTNAILMYEEIFF